MSLNFNQSYFWQILLLWDGYLRAVSLTLHVYQETLQVSRRYYNSVPFNINNHSVQSVASTKLANFIRKYALEGSVFIVAMLNSHELTAVQCAQGSIYPIVMRKKTKIYGIPWSLSGKTWPCKQSVMHSNARLPVMCYSYHAEFCLRVRKGRISQWLLRGFWRLDKGHGF